MPKTQDSAADSPSEVTVIEPDVAEVEPEAGSDAPRRRGRPRKVTGISEPGWPDESETGFVDYVNLLPTRAWETHCLKIYRQRDKTDPVLVGLKATERRTWIAEVSGPFEGEPFGEAWIKARYGGGGYTVYLQRQEGRRQVQVRDPWTVQIMGRPINTDEEARIAASLGPQGPGTQPMAQVPIPDPWRDSVQDLREENRELREEVRRANQTLAELHAKAREPETKAVERGFEIVSEAAKKALGFKQPQESNSMEAALTLAERIVTLGRKANPEPAEAPRDPLRDTMERAMMDRLAAILTGEGTPAPAAAVAAPASSGWLDFAKTIAPLIPQAIQSFGAQMQAAHRNRLEAWALQAKLQSGQMKPEELEAEVQRLQAQNQTQAAQQPAGQPNWAGMSAAMVRDYFEGDSGEEVAESLSRYFPQEIQGLKSFLSTQGEWWANAALLSGIGQQMPALKAVFDDHRFQAWAPEFWGALNAPPEPGPEEAA